MINLGPRILENQLIGQPGILLKVSAHHHEAGMKVNTKAMITRQMIRMIKKVMNQPLFFLALTTCGA